MHLRRRLLLAHTGWATVVDPEGRDEVERTVIRAIGPEGQSRIAPIRAAAAAAEAVLTLADRLVAAGLAVPHGTRTTLESAVRAVRGAAVLVVVLAAAAALIPGQDPGYAGPVVAWFGLPLVLTLGCLAIARVENHPYSPWASPSGQQWLDSLAGPGARGGPRSAGGGGGTRCGGRGGPGAAGGSAQRPHGAFGPMNAPAAPAAHRPWKTRSGGLRGGMADSPQTTAVRRSEAEVAPEPDPVSLERRAAFARRCPPTDLPGRVIGNAGYASPATKSATDFLRPV